MKVRKEAMYKKKLFMAGVALLSIFIMFNYKYYEVLTLYDSNHTYLDSKKMFLSRIMFGRTRSRITGKIFNTEIPTSWRSKLYPLLFKYLNINKDEIKYPIESYKSLSELFSRYIKEETRPIEATGSYSLVSPCDSEVVDYGEIKNDYISNVKGLKLHIKEFLGGELKKKYNDNSTKFYYAIFYLSPGKYHRFHSPTKFNCKFRRHISGELFPVFQGFFKFLNNIYNINERVVINGEWKGGNMYYVAVSSYNVGNITLSKEKDFKTNKREKQLSYLGGDIDTRFYDSNDNYHVYDIGEEIGQFRLGSTIVLIFENKLDFKWNIKHNQNIKTGQKIGEIHNEEFIETPKFIKYLL